jgi:hypothetical protein
LGNHQVIVFKSPPTACNIPKAATLAQYKAWYLAMRNVFDEHTDHLFVILTPPPLHYLSTNAAQAANARLLATWLTSTTFLSGHPNVRCYNLFDALAQSDDGSGRANTLRYVYEQSDTVANSIPNALANQNVGPDLTLFLCMATAGY